MYLPHTHSPQNKTEKQNEIPIILSVPEHFSPEQLLGSVVSPSCPVYVCVFALFSLQFPL